jgi:hypothetical protein
MEGQDKLPAVLEGAPLSSVVAGARPNYRLAVTGTLL